jgi:hypothetical protein
MNILFHMQSLSLRLPFNLVGFVQGVTYIAPALCTLVGLIFFHVAAFGCGTFKAESVGRGDADYYLGYFKQGLEGHCASHGGDNADLPGVVRFGRFIGVFGALMIWFVFAVVAAASFFRYPRPKLVFIVVGSCMGVLALFSFLLLSGKSYDDDLKLGPGGILAIFSAFVWIGGAVSTILFMTERPRVGPASAATTTENKPEITVVDGEPRYTPDEDTDAESGIATNIATPDITIVEGEPTYRVDAAGPESVPASRRTKADP